MHVVWYVHSFLVIVVFDGPNNTMAHSRVTSMFSMQLYILSNPLLLKGYDEKYKFATAREIDQRVKFWATNNQNPGLVR